MKKFLLSLILLFFFVLPAWSATYYLDASSGDDSNPGTSAQPWQTIARAYDLNGLSPNVDAGDTVYLRDGTYGNFLDKEDGRADWIIYKADTGHSPTIAGINLLRNPSFPRDAYFKFDGITITTGFQDYSDYYPVGIKGTSYVQFINCDIVGDGFVPGVGATDAGIQMEPYTKKILVSGCSFYGALGDANSGNLSAVASSEPENEDITIVDCDITNMSAGLNIGGANSIIRNCVIHDILDDGILIAEGNTALIENNIIYNLIDVVEMGAHSNGIQKTHNPFPNLTVRNNIIYNVDDEGLFINPNPGSNYLFENNLVYDTGTNGFFHIDGLTLKNNCILGTLQFKGDYPGLPPMVITSMTGNIIEQLGMYPGGHRHGSITECADGGGGTVTITSVGHALEDYEGYEIEIDTDPNYYDGTFTIVSVVDANNFKITDTFEANATGEFTFSKVSVVLEEDDYNIVNLGVVNYEDYTPGPNTVVLDENADILALFEDFPSGGVYRLAANSLAIDFCPLGVAPATDLAGASRVDISGVGNEGTDYADAGCYEYASTTTTTTPFLVVCVLAVAAGGAGIYMGCRFVRR